MKKFKITEASKKTFMEKVFYYIGKGIKPMVIKKMEKNNPEFKKSYSELQKARDKFEASVDRLKHL
jgi:hypothetical protein